MTLSTPTICSSFESFSLLTLAHPTAFCRWCQEVLVEDLFAVHEDGLQDCNLQVICHESTIFVTGTACIPRWNTTGKYPSEVLKTRITERFGAHHPLSNALIIWNVKKELRLGRDIANWDYEPRPNGRDPFIAYEPIVVHAQATQSAWAHFQREAQKAIEVLNADDWPSAVVTFTPVPQRDTFEIQVNRTRAWWRSEYEGYLHSNCGRTGWSTAIAGRAKLCPERIVTAFTHIVADALVRLGVAQTVDVRVTLARGEDAIQCVTVKLEDESSRLAQSLSEKLSAWAPRCEVIWKMWSLDQLNWVTLVEQNATGPTADLLPPNAYADFMARLEGWVQECQAGFNVKTV